MGTSTTTSVGTEYVGKCNDGDVGTKITSAISGHNTGQISITMTSGSPHQLLIKYQWQSSSQKIMSFTLDAQDFYTFRADSGDVVVTFNDTYPMIRMSADYHMYGTDANMDGSNVSSSGGGGFALVKSGGVSSSSSGSSMLIIIDQNSNIVCYDPDATEPAAGTPHMYHETSAGSAWQFAVVGPIFATYCESAPVNARMLFASRSVYASGDEISIGSKYFKCVGYGKPGGGNYKAPLLLARTGAS